MLTVYNELYSLGDRTLKFSKDILEFCKNEKITPINRSLIDQLIRSSTSIGANYHEANNASSRLDFRNKIFIAKKEAAETEYWLSLMLGLTDNKLACSTLKQECHYLLMTFQKIINTLAQRNQETEKLSKR